MTMLLRVAACWWLVCPAAALADAWWVAETPAAMAVSETQQGVFRPGVMPAIGAYVDRGWLALGMRLRAGVLRDGPEPDATLRDPGTGGLLTAAVALRLQWRGGWTEFAGGGGITGSDRVPAVEVGAGWGFAMAGLELGPSLRYLRVASRGSSMTSFGTAELVLLGIDVRFGKARAISATSGTPATTRARRPPPARAEPITLIERDDDPVVELDASCREAPSDCERPVALIVERDRIILDDRVLFELSRSRVRSSGRKVIAQIAELWRQHPDWKRIRIEGHTCDLGSDEMNLALSQRRAAHARAALLQHGFDQSQIDAIGLGRSRPRAAGDSEVARQRNRRVEFVIEREFSETSP